MMHLHCRHHADARARVEADGQTYKVEILDDLADRSRAEGVPMPPTSVYEHGPFTDLCKGPHVASTGRIGPFKLLAVAGAYWRGKSDRPMLQRVYGTVWATQEELDAIVDEAHAYRGLFGAHVGVVLRRLRRACDRYGSQPTFIAASATIAEPAELLERALRRAAAIATPIMRQVKDIVGFISA